jgi:hypothetical protein
MIDRIHEGLLRVQPVLKKVFFTLIILAFLSSLAFLTYRYQREIDLTRNAGNTLSPASIQLLPRLETPISIIAYIDPALPIRQHIRQLIKRYQHYKTDISLKFIDPNSDIATAKRLEIGAQGLVVVTYQQRIEKITFLDESSLTNALLQLSQHHQRWVSFLTGHGERAAHGQANFDLGLFSQALAQRYIKAQTLNFVQLATIPDNTALLVLSAPRVALLPGEITLIEHYIAQGGNLLILTDPDNQHLTPLLALFGVKQLIGTIVDRGSRLYGIDDPSFILINNYSRHPVTKGMQSITVYPMTAALKVTQETDFSIEPILTTLKQAWTETDKIKGTIKFDKNSQEVQGSLTLGLALTRSLTKGRQQRIVIIGDGDFLSNTFLGNVGNLELGLRLVNWLIHDDLFIEVPIKTTYDRSLQLTSLAVGIMGFGFLFMLPITLIVIGFLISYRRKHP